MQHVMQPPLRFHPPRPPTPARSTERKLENHDSVTFYIFHHLSTVLRCSKNSKDLLLLLALAAAAKRGSLGPAKPSSFAASQFSTLFGGKNSATSGDANCGMTLEWYWLGIWNRGILNPMVVFYWELSPVLAHKYIPCEGLWRLPPSCFLSQS